MKSFVLRNRTLIQSSAGLLVIFVAAILLSPTDLRTDEVLFLKADNLTNMLRVSAPVAIIALGMTLVILTGGIDLSVGSTLAFCSVVAALGLSEWNLGIFAAILLAILAGGAVGLLNGSLIAWLKVQPFVITLASMIGVRGLTRWLSNNQNIQLRTAGEVAVRFFEFFSQKTVMIGLFVLLAAVFALLLSGTVFGRYVRALGDNAKASVYAGLPIKRVQIAVYTLTGLLAGLAGVLTCARTTTGNPNDGIAAELDVIAVVVIGGTSLAGGRGSIVGTVIGALIIAILVNILGLRNVGANEQLMLKAVIIVVAVVMQHQRTSS
ncbi:MAG: ABC transporter permease [Planctomycetales bacterium]|nr:ABC transporter permease [Planctomycetales bacterium]